MAYSDKVMDHFYNPRNVGEIENADGVGEVGNAACGDIMKIWITVDEQGIITDAKFRTFGCASAIASSSMATTLIIGKPLAEARALTNKAITEALDGLPPAKIHCSVLAADAINRAIDDHLGIKREGDLEVVCICNNVTRGEIEHAIAHGAFNLDMVREQTGAMGGACLGVRCSEKVVELLKKYQ